MVFSCNPRVPFRQSVSRTLSTIKLHYIQMTSQWPVSKGFPQSTLLYLSEICNSVNHPFPSAVAGSFLSALLLQSLSCVWLFANPWFTACQASLCYLPEFAQTHVHWVSDASQSSHSLSSPSSPAFNLSQHQGLFQWVSSLHLVAKVLELQLQHQSF